MKRSSHIPSLVLSLCAGLPLASNALASTFSWANVLGGSAATAGNWSPVGVPGPADFARFGLANSYSVTFSAAIPATQTLSFVDGTVGLSFTSPHTTDLFVVGADGTHSPNVSVSGGTVNVSNPTNAVRVGSFAGAGASTLTVNGGSSVLRTSAATGDMHIGISGNGTLNIFNGARGESADDILVGVNAGSVGTVSVAGNGLPNPATLVTMSSSGGDATVGVSGSGSVFVRTAGLFDIAHDLTIAQNAGSTGSVTSSTSGLSGTVVVGRDCNIGRNSVAASAAGTGTFNVSGAATATVAAVTRVGDPDGGTGTLNLSGGIFTTHDLTIDPTHGSLNFTGGTLVVDGGIFTPLPGSFIMNTSVGLPMITLRLSNAASAAINGGLSLCSNLSTTARLEVLSGSTVTATTGINFNTAGATGTSSSGLIAGPGSLLSTGLTLVVANAGTASLDVRDGAHVQCGIAEMAAVVGSSATAIVSGPGSQWNCSSLFVGGTSASAGGTAALTLGDTAVMTASSNAIFYPTSTLSITNATLNVAGSMSELGVVNMTGGTISAATMSFANTSNITASGRIDASVSNPSFFSAQLVLNGNLDIGLTSNAGSFGWAGQLGIGAHALTTRQSVNSRLGDVTISGGSITPFVAGRTYSLANGDSLTGFGTINGPISITSASPVTATGANGLTFNGLVTPLISPTLSMSGTRINFGPSGGLTGAGTLNAVVVNQGAITATGDLSMGDGSTMAIVLSGSLNVGAHHVTLNDSNGGGVSSCTIAGGNLESVGSFSGRLLNTVQGFLRGFGTITVPDFRNAGGGHVSPGNPGSSGTGALFFTGIFSNGDLLNTPFGTINIDIRDSESVDQLIIGGAASFGGGTLNVSLINGFVPTPGSRFTFLTAASVTGAFATANLPAGAVVIYNPASIDVLFPCPADFNLDGTVDFFDYLDFVDAFSSNLPAADFNNDGSIDFFDYLDFVDAFSSGC